MSGVTGGATTAAIGTAIGGKATGGAAETGAETGGVAATGGAVTAIGITIVGAASGTTISGAETGGAPAPGGAGASARPAKPAGEICTSDCAHVKGGCRRSSFHPPFSLSQIFGKPFVPVGALPRGFGCGPAACARRAAFSSFESGMPSGSGKTSRKVQKSEPSRNLFWALGSCLV